MIKRLICVTLLLTLLCLSLASCGTANALAPTFWRVASDKTSSFLDKTSNLLAGNTPLCLEGNLNYCFSEDGSCREQALSLIRTIEQKTGVDLTEGTDPSAPKLSIGLGLREGLSPASYFIGFDGDDLLITAQNIPMLEMALKDFTENYVCSPNANIGEGFFYLPGDLAYTSPTVSLFDEAGDPIYTVIFPDESGEWFFSSVTMLNNAIKEIGGDTLPSRSDFLGDPTNEEKEILMGVTTREESQKLAKDLGRDDYYISVTENKIIILAHNPWTLSHATSRLISLFLTDASTVELPASFELRS